MTPDSPSTHHSVFQQMRDPVTREAGITRLFDRYKGYIQARCRARGLQDADADDVTQVVLIKLGDKIEGYDHRRPFRPWLRTVIANAVEDHRRAREGREDALGDSTEAGLRAQAADDGPDDDEDREMALMVELVRRVEAEQRPDFEAFWLLNVAGWTTTEIGLKLGKQPNNVSQMAFRGKRWAKAMLALMAEKESGR